MMDQATTGLAWNPLQSNEILQHLCNGSLCVIPSAIVNNMLESVKLLAKCTESIATSLNAVVSKPASDFSTEISSADILRRLDNLTTIIKSSTSTLKEDDTVRMIQKDVKLRSSLFQKQLHAEKVSELYKEVISDDDPYSPPKFRVKVAATTIERERNFYREQTIFSVETQIKILQGNIVLWKDEISSIDRKRETLLDDHPEKREFFEKRIHRDEEKAVKSVNGAIYKLRKSYDEEKRTFPNADFLLSSPVKRSQRRFRSSRWTSDVG